MLDLNFYFILIIMKTLNADIVHTTADCQHESIESHGIATLNDAKICK